MIGQFKTHVWSLMEIHSGGMFHASPHLWNKIDEVQRRFLRDLRITEENAFMMYNFAPSQMRRRIGILGLLHKRVIGESHPVYVKLLPFCSDAGQPVYPGGHNKQLYNHLHEVRFQMNLFCRSIFSMVPVYNMLPQSVVNTKTVRDFQKRLTVSARMHCTTESENWQEICSRP